jgi:hypothetical protein
MTAGKRAMTELDVWSNRLARTLLVAGATFWIASQVSDLLLDGIDSLSWTTTPEETAESAGSVLWLFLDPGLAALGTAGPDPGSGNPRSEHPPRGRDAASAGGRRRRDYWMTGSSLPPKPAAAAVAGA